MAKDDLDKGWIERAEQALASAVQIVDRLDATSAAPLRTEIDEIRARIAAMPTEDETRSISAVRREIRNIRSRIETIGATISITSDETGTTIEVRVPSIHPAATEGSRAT